MIQLIEYNLPDAKLIARLKAKGAAMKAGDAPQHQKLQFWVTHRIVIIGASNKIETAVNIQACLEDGVPVMKRPSGGEAVLVSEGSLLFSHILLNHQLPRSRDFFGQNLDLFIRALEAKGVKNLHHQGISDLTIGDKKILGCAIYRSTGFLLFQAVLNLWESPQVIAKYLAAPVRMPDYRQNRSHEQFITSLKAEGYPVEDWGDWEL